MSTTTKAPRRTRHEASQYLKERWGIVRSPKTLSNLATAGVLRPGYDGNRPLYSEEILDEFARSVIDRLSDRPANGRRQVQQAA